MDIVRHVSALSFLYLHSIADFKYKPGAGYCVVWDACDFCFHARLRPANLRRVADEIYALADKIEKEGHSSK